MNNEQEELIMKGFVNKAVLSAMLCIGLVFAREKTEIHKENNSLINGGKEYVINSSNETIETSLNREEIILWEEDFESGQNGWSLGSGWELTSSSYNSETHSALSPDNVANMNNVHNLLTPAISLPQLGDGETMNFGFWLWDDQPGSSQVDDPSTTEDESTYLADYYSISVLDLDALAWHASSSVTAQAQDGETYWCSDEEVGGYLDSWVQFMDTPAFIVPSGGALTADMMWTIESDAGASVAGTCTDGWDAANVRISADGGETWALLNASGIGNDYDFECGYGWIWNDGEYDTGGSLNHLAAGWGNNRDWSNMSFDLDMYTGQEVIVRFAFGSDPAYSTIDDSGITGLRVDNIQVSGTLDCSPETDCDISVNGEVWVDQFYDYGSCADDRPGCSDEGWEEYLPGMAFNGNVFMDISSFAGKDVVFRFQSRYDDTQSTGQGTGLHIDDFKIYKISGGNYPAPINLTAEPGDSEAMLSWYDMNASGTDDFVYHNGSFSEQGGITLTDVGTAWAGERFDIFGAATVNSITIHSINTGPVDVTIAGFGQLGTLFNTESAASIDVTLQPGDNTFDVNWEMTNSFIIGHTFTDVIIAGLDSSPNSENSMVFLGGGWDPWSDYEATILPGEWGISANITYDGAGVTYNVYRDGAIAASGIASNMHTDSGLTNNQTYEYVLTATYSDGEESGESNIVEVTPFANTVHEEGYDDGTFESEFNAGSGNFSAVRFSANSSGEDLVRFKWHQSGDGGAFYIKVFEDDGGMPGAEIYSAVQASGNSDGWNEKDLSSQGLNLMGAFWIGTKEFSSSKPFGLDTSSDSGNSYQRAGSSGDWTAISGNLSYHVYLDCGDNCEDDSCTNDAGDVNEDGMINILDIVNIANAVLGDSLSDCAAEAADVNGDGDINILDIVSVANIILGGRTNDASSAKLNNTGDAILITANGFIGGIQMTLSHNEDFKIQLTDNALFAKSITKGNQTTLVVVIPENEEIFTYSGEFEITDMIVANSNSEISVNMPSMFELSAAYPNPFNPTTSISLHVPMEGEVDVNVYDLSGRVVSNLLSGYQAQGNYHMTWNASEQASGMYLVRAETNSAVSIQKILLLK